MTGTAGDVFVRPGAERSPGEPAELVAQALTAV
jgi:hypothetical protein